MAGRALRGLRFSGAGTGGAWLGLAWLGLTASAGRSPGSIASQVGRQQPRQRRLLHAPALGHGLQLVLADRADAEVSAVGVGQVEAADARCGGHGQAPGQAHADVCAFPHPKQPFLLAVARGGGVAGGGADATVFFRDQFGRAEPLVGRVAPQVGAHALVQAFGKGFGQAVGQAFEQDGAVIVERGDEVLLLFLDPQARRHGKQAGVVGDAAVLGCDEIRQAAARAHDTIDDMLLRLLAQAVPGHRAPGAGVVGVELDVLAHAVGRQQGHHAAGREPAAGDDFLEHGLAVGGYAGGGGGGGGGGMIFLSMAWPSANTRLAAAPTTASVRMAGYGPARSQVWKNGPQSMYFSNPARSKFLNTRRPMARGAAGWQADQSMGVLFARALARGHSGSGFLLACRRRTLS